MIEGLLLQRESRNAQLMDGLKKKSNLIVKIPNRGMLVLKLTQNLPFEDDIKVPSPPGVLYL